MIIDIGGIPSKENAEMIKGATHAIILAGSEDGRARKGGKSSEDKSGHGAFVEMDKWRDFFDDNGLVTIARLHSNYNGTGDKVAERNGEVLTGSVHYQ